MQQQHPSAINLAVRQTIVIVLLEGIVATYLEYIDAFVHFVQSHVALNDNVIAYTALQSLIKRVV